MAQRVLVTDRDLTHFGQSGKVISVIKGQVSQLDKLIVLLDQTRKTIAFPRLSVHLTRGSSG